jgi:hypothetical protein
MRLLRLYTCLLAFLPACLSAQNTQPGIKNEMLPQKGIYRFPAFTEGTVVFRNGMISSERFNFNISLDEMHFISQQGDTLSLADPVTINFVSLNGSRFYYDKGYLQSLDTAGDIILAFKQDFIVQEQRPGAYGTTTPHEGTRSYSYFTGHGQKYVLGENEKVTLTPREYYFFGDAYGHFSKAGKDFILDHFVQHQADIKAFLKTNHTNFNKLADLQKLMTYCSKLDAG